MEHITQHKILETLVEEMNYEKFLNLYIKVLH